MVYKKHLFFCINRRDSGKKCCMDGGADRICAYAKKKVRQYPELADVRVNKSGCLGRCQLGPSLVIYPEGIWYQYHHTDDIDEIIHEHLLHGRVVERLLMGE